MKQKLFTLLTLLLCVASGAWATDIVWTFNASDIKNSAVFAPKGTNTFVADDGSTELVYKGNSNDDALVSSDATIGGTSYSTYLNLNGATSSGRYMYFSGISGQGTLTIVFASGKSNNTAVTINDNAYDGTAVATLSVPSSNYNGTAQDIAITSTLEAEHSYYINGIRSIYAVIWSPSSKVTPKASFSTSTYNLTPANYTSFVAPTLSVLDGDDSDISDKYTISYASDNSDVVEVTTAGVVTIHPIEGTYKVKVTATLTSKDTEHYNNGSATYTVNFANGLATISDKFWKFGDAAWSSFPTSSGDGITGNTIVDNMEVLANSSNKAYIQSSEVTFSDGKLSKYIQFGQVQSEARQFHIKVAANSRISVYAKAGGSSRKIKVTKDSKDGDVIGTEQDASSSPTIYTFDYTGKDAANLYIFNSGSNSLNFYGIKVTPLYTITYDLNGGTGTTPTESPKVSGAKFTLHNGTTGITTPTGKEFSKWVDQDADEFDGSDEYTMPAKNVTLTAKWIDEVVKYAVTKGTHANGDFSIDKTSVAAGETVTLTATPDFKYVLDSWSVYKTGEPGTTVTVTSNQFTMPAYAVTVDATFTADARKQILYLTTTAKATTEANDKLYAALNSVDDYNVIIEAPASQTLTDYDLIVLHESIGGTSDATAVTGCKTTTTPVLNTKSYFYGADGDASKRWQWGAPNAGKSVKGATLSTIISNIASHPLFSNGVVSTNFVEITDDAEAKCMQPVGSFVDGKEGYVLATTDNASSGIGAAIHELTPAQRGVASGKFLMISVSNAKLNALNDNGQQLFKNAAAYLMGATAFAPTYVTTTVTTNKGKWTSFTPSWNATLESGAKAYYVTAVTSSTITATAVDVLKAGQGYFIKGEAASTEYTVTATDVNADATTGTLMVGQLASTTINTTTPDGNDKYVLGTTAGGKSGLFQVDSDVTVGAGKAYLNTGTTGGAHVLSLDLEDGGATGINNVNCERKSLLDGDFYNLKGQRVAQPSKGLYIINGRKVVIR